MIAAAAGMVFSFAAYAAGRRHMPDDVLLARPAANRGQASRLSGRDVRILAAILLVLLAVILNVGTYNQAFNIFPVWAKAHVNRDLFGFEMPVTWFSTLDGILTIVATAAAVRFWGWQSSRGVEPRETSRIAIGCTMTAGAFLMLTLGSLVAGSGKVAIVFPLAFFALADGALPWVDTVVMAFITRASPPRLTSTLLGIYFLCFTAGNFLVGSLGRLYESMTPVAFWGTHAGLVAVAAVFLVAIGAWVSRLLNHPHDELPEAAPAQA